ncbi:MAG: hypothetical protein IJL35_02310 [Bacteroidaceae bacterium]|nr:hypothetical protein [Bacteroidaceae bacterium]
MNREEKYLRQRFGNESPFRVPEGYFGDFNARIMEQLPETTARTVTLQPSGWQRWRPFVAAASVCAIIFGAGLFYFDHLQEPVPTNTAANNIAVESNLDQAADYAMIDNNDIYSYLADY